VRFLTKETLTSGDESWIIEAPGRNARRCAPAWRTALVTKTGFRVLRRTARDTC
jgi:hypothetical protein